MKKQHLTTFIIALCIAWGVEVLEPLVQTILDFSFGIQLLHPLTHYLLWGYLPAVLSGIYIGVGKINKKTVTGAAVGLLYCATFSLCVGLFTNPHSSGGMSWLGYACVKRGIICAMLAWATDKIKHRLIGSRIG